MLEVEPLEGAARDYREMRGGDDVADAEVVADLSTSPAVD